MSLLGEAQLRAALALEGSLGARSAMTALRPLAFRGDQSDDSRRALAQWMRLADVANDALAFEEGLVELRRADRPDEMVRVIDQLRPMSALNVGELIASRFVQPEYLHLAGRLAASVGDRTLARRRFEMASAMPSRDASLMTNTMFELAKLGACERDGSMVKYMNQIQAALLTDEQRRSYDRWSLWNVSPHLRATAIEVLASRSEHDVLLRHAMRMHVFLTPVELDRLQACARASSERRLLGVLERVTAIQYAREEPVAALRSLGRMDFSIETWLAFAAGNSLPRAVSADGTAASLISCLRDHDEARANDVVKLMNELPIADVTVLCWTAMSLALGFPRVADFATRVAQRWLTDDETIVPVRGYLWLGRLLSSSGRSAILAYERASYLREKGASEALRAECVRQAHGLRAVGNIRDALALVRSQSS